MLFFIRQKNGAFVAKKGISNIRYFICKCQEEKNQVKVTRRETRAQFELAIVKREKSGRDQG